MPLGISSFVGNMLLFFRTFQNFFVFDIHRFCVFHSNVSKIPLYIYIYLSSSALNEAFQPKAVPFSLIVWNLSILFLQIFPSLFCVSLLWDSCRCWAHFHTSSALTLSYSLFPYSFPSASSLLGHWLLFHLTHLTRSSAGSILLLIPSPLATVLLKRNPYTLFFSVILSVVTMLL